MKQPAKRIVTPPRIIEFGQLMCACNDHVIAEYWADKDEPSYPFDEGCIHDMKNVTLKECKPENCYIWANLKKLAKLTAVLAVLLLSGCSKTIPLTPRIGVDFGVVAVNIGGVAELEWRGMDKSDVPEDNSGGSR